MAPDPHVPSLGRGRGAAAAAAAADSYQAVPGSAKQCQQYQAVPSPSTMHLDQACTPLGLDLDPARGFDKDRHMPIVCVPT